VALQAVGAYVAYVAIGPIAFKGLLTHSVDFDVVREVRLLAELKPTVYTNVRLLVQMNPEMLVQIVEPREPLPTIKHSTEVRLFTCMSAFMRLECRGLSEGPVTSWPTTLERLFPLMSSLVPLEVVEASKPPAAAGVSTYKPSPLVVQLACNELLGLRMKGL